LHFGKFGRGQKRTGRPIYGCELTDAEVPIERDKYCTFWPKYGLQRIQSDVSNCVTVASDCSACKAAAITDGDETKPAFGDLYSRKPTKQGGVVRSLIAADPCCLRGSGGRKKARGR
jgi:hypothetical protein